MKTFKLEIVTPEKTVVSEDVESLVVPAQDGYLGVLAGHEPWTVLLKKGDTIALPPNVPHSFRVVGDEAMRLLGTHVSPRRIVNYRDGRTTDARGYAVLDQ